MTRRTTIRAAVACAGAGIIFTAFSIRLINLQVVKHDEYTELAARKHSIRQVITARRGGITDRHGEILAANIPVRKVVVDGSHVNDPAKLAEVASPYLAFIPEELEKALRTDSKYKVLFRGLEEEKAIALRREMVEKSLRGLYFYEETERIYPNGEMLAHVLGFLRQAEDPDDAPIGAEGIERSMERHLRGLDGFRHIERDRTGREIVVYRGAEQGPRNGLTVELTIDMGLQAILEDELESAFEELEPNSAVGVMVDPRTGEVLAMASRPSFDPNNLGDSPMASRLNQALMAVLEPGSTFKIVVASAALTEGVVDGRTQIFCENGRFFYAGRTLRDVHGHGQMGVRDILVKSSNIGSAKMALMLGEDRFYEYVRRFGFGERTGIELPGEVRGILSPPSRWDKLTITRMPMGHSIAVTPLQMAMAMSAIANGGNLMRPQILRTVREPGGNALFSARPEVVRRVIPEQTAQFVGEALCGVTAPGGTARLAGVSGFQVAGKTGTAQKVDPNGGYAPGKYVVSFLGYMPAEDPAFVCLILIDDATKVHGANYGGVLAAPVFARVGERAARYLNLVPSMRAEAVLPLVMNNPQENPTGETAR
jgi:cell division protein FtsI/penicillin-binding protein 2